MKAIICTKYGPPEVLKIAEVEKPIPKDNEVLAKIHAATVSSGDMKIRGVDMPFVYKLLIRLLFGFKRPKKNILGSTFAGEIKSVGKDVTLYKKGDKVFGINGMRMGCYAEYVAIKENGAMIMMPSNMTYEEAVPVPFGAMSALHLLRKANINKGQKVLIYGASGAVGTYAVQLAKHFGAEVTGVCSSANLDLVKSLGADHVIDYTKEDYAQSSNRYDVVFDAVWKTSKAHSKKVLKKDGIYISVNQLTNEKKEKLLYLRELIEAGKLKTVIDRRYPLDQMIIAHRYVEKGHKKGNVVVNMLPQVIK